MQHSMFTINRYKEILLIALPIMAGMLSQNVIQITNTAFLGRLGEEALGVSAMGGLFYMLLSVLSWGFSSGTQILVARRLGEKKITEIGSLMFHNSIIMLAYAVLAFLILVFVSLMYVDIFYFLNLLFLFQFSFQHNLNQHKNNYNVVD